MIEYYPGLPYTVPYKILINPDKSYNDRAIGLLSKFSWYNDVAILIPDIVGTEEATKFVNYLRAHKVRSPKVTYIVYAPLIQDLSELEGIVESM